MAIRPTTKHNIQIDEENTNTPNFSVITKLIASGTLSIAFTGVDQGTGQVVLYSSGTPFDPSPYLLISQFVPILTGTIANAVSKNPPVGSDSVIIQDGERVTFTNLRSFFKTTYDGFYAPLGGWISDANTWTCFSTDSPIFNVFINANVTGTIGLGNRIQGTQSGANKLFLVHGVSVTGSNTYLNLYGGSDYSLVSGSFTSPQYSQLKAPFGFPLDANKWSQVVSNSNRYTKTAPSNGTWYGNTAFDSGTGPQIVTPIGLWFPSFKALVDDFDTTVTDYNIWVSFSTSASSESDSDMTSLVILTAPSGSYKIWNTASVNRALPISLTSKTTYFIIIKTTTSTSDNIDIRGDVVPTIIRLVSAYL